MRGRNKVKIIAEGGLMIALSVLLSYIKIYQAPNGGSVTAGSMVPLLLFAIRWGIGPGLIIGSIYGLLDFLLKPFFYHWIQFLLDYPVAYGLLGLAGIGYMEKVNKSERKTYIKIIFGVVLAIMARIMAHVISGVVFFADVTSTTNPWVFSIGYNLSYLLPELIISIIVLTLIWKPLKRTILDRNTRG